MRFFFCLAFSLGLAQLSLVAGEEVSIQSYNFPDRYVRHHDGIGELALVENDIPSANYRFVKSKGLDGTDSLSLEAANSPGKFLRHKGFRIVLEANDGSELFKKDASFRVVPGLADTSGASFESVNKPGFYIRHKNFRLLLESGEDDHFQQDCTFSFSTPIE